MHDLAVYVKEGLPFAWDLNSASSYLCFRLASLHTQFITSFSSIDHILHPYPQFFGSTSSNIDEVLLINPSANELVLGDFNIHHKDWLTYSGGTDRSGELCCNFSISNDLTQMVSFPTQIPGCALLDLFPSSDPSICSTMAFPQF